MFGYVSAKTHAADLAAKDALIDSLDKTAGMYRQRYEDSRADVSRLVQDKLDLVDRIKSLQSRLDALTPARGQGGRFAKRKAVSNG